jgi:putative endonuclease
MNMPSDVYWVYILQCENQSYYTGYTTDLMRRYQDHQSGKCKYTRSFKPIAIAKAWKISGTKGSAMKVENVIKKMTHQEKFGLLQNPERLFEVCGGLAVITVVDTVA